MWLYDMAPEDIEIVIHRESIVHSLIEFEDGAVLAQLDVPDMRLPIQYALTYPARVPCKMERLNLAKVGHLSFYAPDEQAFPALRIARETARRKGNAGAIMNGANEAAVGLFLERKIGFSDIPRLVERALDTLPQQGAQTIDEVLAFDRMARESVYSSI